MPVDRDYLLRLTPDRALETLDDAEAFVRERGLVTLLPSTSLPSLFAACHEEPYSEDGRGFAGWPKTKWWWGDALEQRGLLYAKLLRGTGVFLSDEVADELNLVRGSFRGVRKRLERLGAVVARSVRIELDDERHRHASELRRWDQVRQEPSEHGGLDDLLVAGVRAAVVAPEHEVRSWFSWRATEEQIERLLADGRLARPQPGVLTA